MCDVTRRSFITSGAAFLGAIAADGSRRAAAEIGRADKVAPDVYFVPDEDGCNTGWVVFEDYVLVIDANFPSGAGQMLTQIRAATIKPEEG